MAFLEQLQETWPEGKLILILDNLSIHRSLEVQLWTLANKRVRFLFQPTCAPWLNLIEPWWKTLRPLALSGFRFDRGEIRSRQLLGQQVTGMSIAILISSGSNTSKTTYERDHLAIIIIITPLRHESLCNKKKPIAIVARSLEAWPPVTGAG